MAEGIVILMVGLLAGVLAAVVKAARSLAGAYGEVFRRVYVSGSGRVAEVCVFGSITRVTGNFGLKSGTPLGPKRTSLGPPLDPVLIFRGSVLEGGFFVMCDLQDAPRTTGKQMS